MHAERAPQMDRASLLHYCADTVNAAAVPDAASPFCHLPVTRSNIKLVNIT